MNGKLAYGVTNSDDSISLVGENASSWYKDLFLQKLLSENFFPRDDNFYEFIDHVFLPAPDKEYWEHLNTTFIEIFNEINNLGQRHRAYPNWNPNGCGWIRLHFSKSTFINATFHD